MSNEFQKMPEEGTPEFDAMMRQYYGDDYELGYRVGFGKRFGAYLIDKILLGIISTIVMMNNSSFMAFVEENQGAIDYTNESLMEALGNRFGGILEELSPIFLFIAFIYFATEIFFAQSIGKMIVGIKIGNANRTKADLSQLLIRFFVKQADVVIGLLGVITTLSVFGSLSSFLVYVVFFGYFMVFGRTRQALHDLPAKTAVFAKDGIKEN